MGKIKELRVISDERNKHENYSKLYKNQLAFDKRHFLSQLLCPNKLRYTVLLAQQENGSILSGLNDNTASVFLHQMYRSAKID